MRFKLYSSAYNQRYPNKRVAKKEGRKPKTEQPESTTKQKKVSPKKKQTKIVSTYFNTRKYHGYTAVELSDIYSNIVIHGPSNLVERYREALIDLLGDESVGQLNALYHSHEEVLHIVPENVDIDSLHVYSGGQNVSMSNVLKKSDLAYELILDDEEHLDAFLNINTSQKRTRDDLNETEMENVAQSLLSPLYPESKASKQEPKTPADKDWIEAVSSLMRTLTKKNETETPNEQIIRPPLVNMPDGTIAATSDVFKNVTTPEQVERKLSLTPSSEQKLEIGSPDVTMETTPPITRELNNLRRELSDREIDIMRKNYELIKKNSEVLTLTKQLQDILIQMNLMKEQMAKMNEDIQAGQLLVQSLNDEKSIMQDAMDALREQYNESVAIYLKEREEWNNQQDEMEKEMEEILQTYEPKQPPKKTHNVAVGSDNPPEPDPTETIQEEEKTPKKTNPSESIQTETPEKPTTTTQDVSVGSDSPIRAFSKRLYDIFVRQQSPPPPDSPPGTITVPKSPPKKGKGKHRETPPSSESGEPMSEDEPEPLPTAGASSSAATQPAITFAPAENPEPENIFTTINIMDFTRSYELPGNKYMSSPKLYDMVYNERLHKDVRFENPKLKNMGLDPRFYNDVQFGRKLHMNTFINKNLFHFNEQIRDKGNPKFPK